MCENVILNGIPSWSKFLLQVLGEVIHYNFFLQDGVIEKLF